MASEKTNSCLICKKTFADHLAFYEHVMSHDDAKLRENDDDDDDDDDVVLAQRLRVGSEASSDRDETTMEAAAGPVVVSYGSLANGVMLAAHSYPYPYSPSLEREGGRGTPACAISHPTYSLALIARFSPNRTRVYCRCPKVRLRMPAITLLSAHSIACRRVRTAAAAAAVDVQSPGRFRNRDDNKSQQRRDKVVVSDDDDDDDGKR